ncbi:MAG: rRNA maturation RNase YbeY [Opitutales bacterium]
MLNPEVSNLYEALKDPETATIACCRALERSGSFPISPGDLSVVFVDDVEIARIHGQFMADPAPTDVITFPSDGEMESAGEIIISVDQARSRAAELDLPFSRELCLYLVHGWLHLAGYDDRTEADRRAMRTAEEQALALVEDDPSCIPFSLKPTSK